MTTAAVASAGTPLDAAVRSMPGRSPVKGPVPAPGNPLLAIEL
jgi:hypothetical protein